MKSGIVNDKEFKGGLLEGKIKNLNVLKIKCRNQLNANKHKITWL